jgi:hypothetical protein
MYIFFYLKSVELTKPQTKEEAMIIRLSPTDVCARCHPLITQHSTESLMVKRTESLAVYLAIISATHNPAPAGILNPAVTQPIDSALDIVLGARGAGLIPPAGTGNADIRNGHG